MGNTQTPQQLREAFQLSMLVHRKVSISDYHGDHAWAQHFVDNFGGRRRAFIPRALGLNYEDDEIKSTNPAYVMSTIRERCIDDSSVNLVLLGPCTHSRRFIDWEIKRGLAQKNGLMGIILPPHTAAYLPERFQLNYRPENAGYARLYYYPSSLLQLHGWIEDAFCHRGAANLLVKNPQETWGNNRVCRVCWKTH